MTSLLLLALLFELPAGTRAGAVGIGGKRGLDTMTVNLYVGGGTGRVLMLDTADPAYCANLVSTVTGIYYELPASQPPVRLAGLADEIADRMPDIVAVQEASLIRNQSPGALVLGGITSATNVICDYLAILVDALKARGTHYRVAAVTEEMDVEMPMLNLVTGTYGDARLTDRNAILVRAALPPGQLRVTHPQSGNFATAIQMAQAFEVINGPAKTKLPVVLCGDFNADPLHHTGTATHDAFVAAGFRDTWTATHPKAPAGGLTWGHDEFLADPSTSFVWRLDYALYRGAGLDPINSEVIDMAVDRTEHPLWTSEHAAVAAGFLFQPPRPMRVQKTATSSAQ